MHILRRKSQGVSPTPILRRRPGRRQPLLERPSEPEALSVSESPVERRRQGGGADDCAKRATAGLCQRRQARALGVVELMRDDPRVFVGAIENLLAMSLSKAIGNSEERL